MRLKWLGWIVGLTYGTATPQGLDYAHFEQLLEEMATHHMNLLSIMMQSYAIFDPMHDGYAWPVQNPKLAVYRDDQALNSHQKTEFLSRVIHLAESRGITIEFCMNWGIWNHAKIISSYPNATIQQAIKGIDTPLLWVHCPDSPDAWQLGIDEVEDLMQYYHHLNVKRFTFERLGYVGRKYCHCTYSQDLYRSFLTSNHLKDTPKSHLTWKIHQTGSYITNYINILKRINPDLEVGVHSSGNLGWGHDPQHFSDWGLSYCEPHILQHKMSKWSFDSVLRHLSPNPCVLNFDLRHIAPQNYPIWIKTPRIIQNALNWTQTYQGSNIEGILFFNEPTISAANRQAMYDGLQQFHIE